MLASEAPCLRLGASLPRIFFQLELLCTFDYTLVASLADKDSVVICAEHIQLTNMQASEALSRRRGASLESIFVSWICRAQLITGLCQLVMRR